MTTDRLSAPIEIGTSETGTQVGILDAFLRALESGAAYVDAQFGHPPGKLIVGGLAVWAACVAYMLDSVATLRDLGTLLITSAH